MTASDGGSGAAAHGARRHARRSASSRCGSSARSGSAARKPRDRVAQPRRVGGEIAGQRERVRRRGACRGSADRQVALRRRVPGWRTLPRFIRTKSVSSRGERTRCSARRPRARCRARASRSRFEVALPCLAVHHALAAEHVDVREHARRRRMADADHLRRLALAAIRRAEHLHACRRCRRVARLRQKLARDAAIVRILHDGAELAVLDERVRARSRTGTCCASRRSTTSSWSPSARRARCRRPSRRASRRPARG